jgi:ribose transport system permease protein
VRISTPADVYKEQKLREIEALREEMAESGKSGDRQKASELQDRIAAIKKEVKETYRKMKAEEKAEQARIRAEERESERQFQEMLREKSRDGQTTETKSQ